MNETINDDDGFLDQVADLLTGASPEEVSDAVITAALMSGMLDPELEEEPNHPERLRQLQEVFALVDRVTVAISHGSLIPRRKVVPDEMDPDFAAVFAAEFEANRDPEAERQMDALLGRG